MKRLFYIAVLWSLPLFASAQYYLRGEIKDESGRTLPNATILQCSSGYLFHSGASGGFGIPAFKEVDTLVFSLDGFQKKKLPVSAAEFATIVLKTGSKKVSKGFKLASLTKDLKREIQQQWFAGDETYASTIENQIISAHQYPSTGLTLNVDRASYSNIRRFLNTKTVVPPDAVRIEEMLNYFNFGYTEPADGKTFEIDAALTQCPWNGANQLLFATIKSKKVPLENLPPSNLVFLIDISGSMDMPNRLPLLKAGFRGLVTNLRDIDSVSIVVYGGTVGIALNTTGGGEKQKILNIIDSLQPGGATPGESGVKLAYSVARNHFIKGGNNRVILATDGDFNVGLRSENDLEELIAAQRESGIYLTCLGVGMGNYKDSKIQTLAQKGNGNFAYIDSYAEAEKVLLTEFLQTLYAIADDVYLNVEFDPAYIKSYRLIGFDNKVGAIRDTAAIVEGGEIGSAFSMMVAFEVVPAHPIADSLAFVQPVKFALQYKLPNHQKLIEQTEKPTFRFMPLAQQQKMYGFACAVIEFGSLLRNSGFVKEGSWNNVLSLATSSVDKNNISQMEFLELVRQAKIIYNKKRKR